jgi:hypothetical protein
MPAPSADAASLREIADEVRHRKTGLGETDFARVADQLCLIADRLDIQAHVLAAQQSGLADAMGQRDKARAEAVGSRGLVGELADVLREARGNRALCPICSYVVCLTDCRLAAVLAKVPT